MDESQLPHKSKERKRISLGIVKMSCASCAQTIEKALKEHVGVEQANVNFVSERAYLTYDPKVTNKKELIETVRATGYEFGDGGNQCKPVETSAYSSGI